MNNDCRKLGVFAFGMGIGLYSALCMLILGWAAWLSGGGWGEAVITMAGSYYVGYTATFLGGIVGAIWGLIHGFIAGALIAWFYNCCLKCPMCCKKDKQGNTSCQ